MSVNLSLSSHMQDIKNKLTNPKTTVSSIYRLKVVSAVESVYIIANTIHYFSLDK